MLRDEGQTGYITRGNAQPPMSQKKLNPHSDWCHNPQSPAPNGAKMRLEKVQHGSQQECGASTAEPLRKKETAISSQKPK